MVTSLDEIVWAVNPDNDSLPSLASYLRHVAEDFFRTTDTLCLFDVEASLPAVELTSEIRHNLCLAVREALNNVVKHSRAGEVWLRIHCQQRSLTIVIEDDGCGLGAEHGGPGSDGLRNMRARMEKIGGHFECDPRPGHGTVCRFSLTFS
jgi:signal transduction histidine kinase